MMQGIKKEIEEVVSSLKKEGKEHLASEIRKNWRKNLLEYSKHIHSYRPDRPMEKILKRAFLKEFKRLGYATEESAEIIKHMEKRRILETAPHISPAGKPRFFFIDWLASLALSVDDFLPIAMFSGVPFSNKTRPGRLCRRGGDINLLSSAMQDELAYRSKIPPKMEKVIKNQAGELKTILPKAKIGESYTKWALQASQNIEGRFLGGRPVFFDFNEVASNYLLLAIKDAEHPVSRMLFSPSERKITARNFKQSVFFYASYKKNGREQMESFFLRDGYLENATRRIKLDPKILAEELRGRLCPGLVIGFFIFSFMNRFQCFGSFAQVEYLPLYRKKFIKFPFLKKYDIKNAPSGVLTTGGFPENPELHPLDVALGDKFSPNPTLLFGQALLAIKDVLLEHNYSLNLVKK